MTLLLNPEDRGYPVDYLLSRIRGRRSRLITDWRSLIYETEPLDHLAAVRYRGVGAEKNPEGVWRRLLEEYGWIYAQMNEPLRKIFRPFFLYSELRTLFMCLRHMKDRKAGKIEYLLSASLLSDAMKKIIETGDDVAAAVAGIERLFLGLSGRFRGLVESFDAEGLRGAEQRLTNTYLVHTVNAKLHPLMKAFFIRIIDSRNIMGLYKAIRLEGKTAPVFVPGGNISEERFSKILGREDIFEISSLIRKLTGTHIDGPDATKVELALYKGITRFLKKEGGDPLGLGLILDYLWRCSLEAMNLSVLIYGKDLEREAVAAELVY